MTALVEHKQRTVRYAATCEECRWWGAIRQVSNWDSAPNWHAMQDAERHNRQRHAIRWLFRDVFPVVTVSVVEFSSPGRRSHSLETE